MSPGFVLWGAMLITFATSPTVRDSPPDYRHLTSTSTPTRARDLQTKRSLGVRSTDSGDLWEMSPLDSRTRIVAECQISSAPTSSRLDTDERYLQIAAVVAVGGQLLCCNTEFDVLTA
uniref:HDC14534 n=1 Tax=Drosophila melanogaster TaxID=7227 RepID=Q6IJN7_DROME|nr:TPA_inf: HDC14534 [Drosophila melanogaster]